MPLIKKKAVASKKAQSPKLGGRKPRLAVIEPHPDDAYLSLGWHLEKLWRDVFDITIITVFTDEKRTKEAEAYAAKIGVASVSLGLTESKMEDSSSPTVIQPLKLMLERDKYNVTVFPIGLQHRDHKSVAMTRMNDSWRYLDTPYQCKQKLGDELREKLRGKEVVSVAYPSKTKWRHIPIFKSQSKFFYFNDMEEMTPCELVLK